MRHTRRKAARSAAAAAKNRLPRSVNNDGNLTRAAAMADEINYVVGNAATLQIQALWRRSLVRERTYLELKAVWRRSLIPSSRSTTTTIR